MLTQPVTYRQSKIQCLYILEKYTTPKFKLLNSHPLFSISDIRSKSQIKTRPLYFAKVSNRSAVMAGYGHPEPVSISLRSQAEFSAAGCRAMIMAAYGPGGARGGKLAYGATGLHGPCFKSNIVGKGGGHLHGTRPQRERARERTSKRERERAGKGSPWQSACLRAS